VRIWASKQNQHEQIDRTRSDQAEEIERSIAELENATLEMATLGG
jgi:hypothetical protein